MFKLSGVEFVADMSFVVKIRIANGRCQDDSKFTRSILSGTKHFAGAAQWESNENWFLSNLPSYCCYLTQSSHSDKENTKQMFPWKLQIFNVSNKLNIRNTSSSRAKQYANHH